MMIVHHEVRCDGPGCTSNAGEKYIGVLVGEIAPTLYMPEGWVQFRDRQFCPVCRRANVPQSIVVYQKYSGRLS